MASVEKILNTRIVLKHDSLDNWNSSSLILKEGEIALAQVEAPTESQGNYNAPTYLIKVGDNKSTFANLKWMAATAADVYNWAKQKKLAITLAGPADGNGIASIVATDAGITVTRAKFDTQGSATTAFNNAKSYADEKLSEAKIYAEEQRKLAESAAATDATNKANTAEKNAIKVANDNLTTAKADATTKASTAESNAKSHADTKASTAESNAKSHADSLNTAMDNRVKVLEAAVGEGGSVGGQIDAKIALLDVDTVTAGDGYVISAVGQKDGKINVSKKLLTSADIPSIPATKITGLDTKIESYDYATKAEAQGYANAKDAAIQEAKGAAATAQAAAEGAQGTADTAVANAATAQAGVNEIKKDYLKAADKTELTKADNAQVERIVALEKKITGVTGAMHFVGAGATLPESGADGDVYAITSGSDKGKEYVWSNGAWVELGDTSEEAKEISALKGRVSTAEGKLTTIQGTGDGSIKKALADAKAYTDDLAKGAVASNTSKIGTNTSNIATNTAAIAAINNSKTGILANANAHSDSLNSKMNTRVADLEAKEGKWDAAATKANSAVQQIVESDTNGNIAVDGKNVPVHGLGSAAYTDSGTYATSAQGKKADTAIQSGSFAGKALTKDGTSLSISQNDARTALGLGSAAYTNSGTYATAAQGKKADTAVQPADLNALNSAKHTHSNKGELDKIASGDKAKWDAAATKANSALQDVTAGVGLKRSAKGQISFDDACVFVLNCGTSTAVI